MEHYVGIYETIENNYRAQLSPTIYLLYYLLHLRKHSIYMHCVLMAGALFLLQQGNVTLMGSLIAYVMLYIVTVPRGRIIL